MRKFISYIIAFVMLAASLTASADAARQYVPNALTVPSVSGNLSGVNLRSEPSLTSEVLATVDMYREIRISHVSGNFYKAEAICSDSSVRTGYIAKEYIKPFASISTAYIVSSSGSKYDMSYASVYKYPDPHSEVLAKYEMNDNVNVLTTVKDWSFCERDGTYGFIPSNRLKSGWIEQSEISDKEKDAAENSGTGFLFFLPDSKKIVLNGSISECSQPIVSNYDKTMLPIKLVEELWGGNVKWNDNEKLADISIDGKILTLQSGACHIAVDGEKMAFDGTSYIEDGRLYVPIRAICNALGIKLYYFGEEMPLLACREELSCKAASYLRDKYSDIFSHTSEILAWPVPSSSGISSSFGDGRNHKSIDITGNAECEITASASGTVTEIYTGCSHNYPKDASEYCDCGGGYGNYVVISHGNLADGKETQTRYSHLSKINVSPGQKIEAGDIIGTMGSTGHSTGYHLDYELSIDNTKNDPAPYLDFPDDIYDSGNNPEYTKPYIDRIKNYS